MVQVLYKEMSDRLLSFSKVYLFTSAAKCFELLNGRLWVFPV